MAIHYCGHPYTGPKNHLMDNSQATFMDLYCHDSYTDTTFINQNSYADVLLKKIQDIKFSPGIELFNDANNIILFFTKKVKSAKRNAEQSSTNKTRKRVKFTTPIAVSEDSYNNNKTSKNRT